MASEQTFEGWCVYDERGEPNLQTFRDDSAENATWEHVLQVHGDLWANDKFKAGEWKKQQALGYSVRPVTVQITSRE